MTPQYTIFDTSIEYGLAPRGRSRSPPTGQYNDLLDYVIFAVALFYTLTIAGLFALRRTRPEMVLPGVPVYYLWRRKEGLTS